MTKKSVLFTLSFFLVVAGSGAATPAVEPQIPAQVISGDEGRTMETFLSRLAEFGFHGTVLAAKDGEILLHNAYGLAQAHTGVKNYTTTAFSTGSVTKQFTATAIMRLVMEGRLSTDDPITKFFDNVPEAKAGITIHHLLTHSAGLAPEYGPDEEPITRDELVRMVLDSPPVLPVGAKYEYSNAGFSLLAAIVEIVSGMTYEEFLKKELFLPCGMRSTGLKLLAVPDTLIAHSQNEELGYPSPADRPAEHWHLTGNGGILSTTADMYRWHLALAGGDLLSDDVKTQMFTPHIKEYEDGDSYYGYGWVVQESGRGTTVYWHNGGAMPHGWSCAVYRYIDDGAVFIVFANKTMDGMMPVDHIVSALARILFEHEFEMPPAIATVAADEIQHYAGRYTLSEGGAITINVVDGVLSVAPEGQKAIDALFPSPYAPRLPKYNDKTAILVQALANGQFDKAAEFLHRRSPDQDRTAMLREWWESFDSLGAFEKFEIIGTAGGDGARTYCRLHFARGQVPCRFFWMSGQCEGMMSGGAPLQKELLPESKTKFVSYNLRTGGVTAARFFPDGGILISGGEKMIKAQRQE